MLCTDLRLNCHAALASAGASIGVSAGASVRANSCVHALLYINMVSSVYFCECAAFPTCPPRMPNALLHAGCKQQVLCLWPN